MDQSIIKNEMITGQAINWKIVIFKGIINVGEFCKVKITKVMPLSLIGEIFNFK